MDNYFEWSLTDTNMLSLCNISSFLMHRMPKPVPLERIALERHAHFIY